jgi:hypothetical protein
MILSLRKLFNSGYKLGRLSQDRSKAAKIKSIWVTVSCGESFHGIALEIISLSFIYSQNYYARC